MSAQNKWTKFHKVDSLNLLFFSKKQTNINFIKRGRNMQIVSGMCLMDWNTSNPMHPLVLICRDNVVLLQIIVNLKIIVVSLFAL